MKKIYLLHGSLGAGKTTLLNKMLSNDFFNKSVVIENEFASFSIDDYLVDKEFTSNDTKTIAGGCICCTSGNEFMNIISEVINSDSIEKIIIESTGVANSVEIIKQLVLSDGYGDKFEFGLNLMLFDALEDDINSIAEKHNEIELSDIVLISKSDLVSSNKLNTIFKSISRINKNIEISINGIFNTKRYFNNKFNSNVIDKLKKNMNKFFMDDKCEVLSSSYYILKLKGKYGEENVVNFVNALMKDNSMVVKRIKGFYTSKDNNQVIINGTKNNTQYTLSNKGKIDNVIVVIGEKLDSSKIELYTKKFLNN